MNRDEGSDRRFVHSRLIDATPEQLFSAFSHPERLTRWWGPDGFSSTFEEFDLRPGGSWRFVMHGPDGTDYPNENVFKTVEPPNRVEIEHISGEHHFILSITFSRQGNQTRVGWVQTFDTVEHKQFIAPWVEPANEQNLDRLQREIAGAGKAGVARLREQLGPASNFSRIGADLVLLGHFLFVAFAVAGGILVYHRPVWALVHIPAVLWSSIVNLMSWTCPLTPLEKSLRGYAGQSGYAGGFLQHYVGRLVYPKGMPRQMELVAGVSILVWNALVYTLIIVLRT